MEMRAYCLSFQTTYACEHSGVCCTAGWPVPIDARRADHLRARALVRTPERTFVRPLHPPPDGSVLTLATAADGACVFFDRAGGRLCRIHRDAGPDLLPSACRNFPRVTLRDRRGLLITLSNYCPTAARLLLRADAIAIVDAPDAVSLSGHVEGLDASAVMPPLLGPGMLMDLEGYARWEREAIGILDDHALMAPAAVAVITGATLEACTWRPGRETLASHVASTFARTRRTAPASSVVPRLEHATKAFLASHLFASWAAYQRGGLHAIVDDLQRALALVGTGHDSDESFVAAVQAADLQLRHTQ